MSQQKHSSCKSKSLWQRSLTVQSPYKLLLQNYPCRLLQDTLLRNAFFLLDQHKFIETCFLSTVIPGKMLYTPASVRLSALYLDQLVGEPNLLITFAFFHFISAARCCCRLFSARSSQPESSFAYMMKSCQISLSTIASHKWFERRRLFA